MHLKTSLLLLLVTPFVFGQAKQSKELSILNKTDFKITYSSDLKLDESGKDGMVFLLLTEKTDSEDNFIENINLIKQDLENLDIDLDKFVAITEKQIIERGKLVDSKRLKRNGMEYQRLVCEVFLHNFDLKFLQYDFVKNNKAYVLTFSAKIDVFEKYLKTIEPVMKSFTLK